MNRRSEETDSACDRLNSDVSHYQGSVNMAAQKDKGARFVIIKATEVSSPSPSSVLFRMLTTASFDPISERRTRTTPSVPTTIVRRKPVLFAVRTTSPTRIHPPARRRPTIFSSTVVAGRVTARRCRACWISNTLPLATRATACPPLRWSVGSTLSETHTRPRRVDIP